MTQVIDSSGNLKNIGTISIYDSTGALKFSATPLNNSVTFAKMQDINTQRVIGRNTAGSGDPEEVTATQVLDWLGSAAQGDILYRGASGWALLAAGTSGNILQTNGGGANPSWVAPPQSSFYESVPTVAASLGASTTTYYIAGLQGGSATQAFRQKSYPEDLTISYLYIRTYTVQPATGSLVLTITSASDESGPYTNEFSVTIAAGSSAALFSDSGSSFTLSAGDYTGLELVNNATSGSAGFFSMGYKATL